MNKQIFKGFKQVTAAQFNAAKEANELVGYLWLVRTEVANEGTNNVDDDEYDLYFGSKQYGHYRAGELDALRDAILKLNGDVEDILATLQALTTLAEKNKTDIATNAAGIAANAAEIADLKDKVDLLPTFDVKVVTELPSDEEAKEKVLYLKKDSEDKGNLYTEYIYVEGKWENLGQQKVDLKDYYTKSEIDTALAGKIDAVKVNGIDATVTEGVAEVTVNATDVKLGAAITADGQEVYTSDKKLSEVLQGIQDSISVAVSGGLTGIVSGNGIEVSEVAGNKQTVSVKVSAADGNLLLMNEDGGLYAAMYYEGDDIE